MDPKGDVIPGASVTVVNKQTGATLSTHSDSEGRWVVSNALPGPTRVSIEHPGFKVTQHELNLGDTQPGVVGTTLELGAVTETVNVTAGRNFTIDGVNKLEEQARKNRSAVLNTASANVMNLQRRVAGVLPVRIEVPRSGRSYRFVRALVLDEETKIAFQYKLK